MLDKEFSAQLIALSEIGHIREAMFLLKKKEPLIFLTKKVSLEKKFLEIKKYFGKKSFFSYQTYIVPLYVEEALKLAKKDNLSVYFSGNPKTGLTSFVYSYSREVLGLTDPFKITSINGLFHFNEIYNDGIIFDTISVHNETEVKKKKHLCREDFIKLFNSKEEVTLKIRSREVLLPAKIPRFFISTHNLDVFLGEFWNDNAIHSKIIEIRIDAPLYIIK